MYKMYKLHAWNTGTHVLDQSGVLPVYRDWTIYIFVNIPILI